MRILLLSSTAWAPGVLRSFPSHGVTPIVALPASADVLDASIETVRIATRGRIDQPVDMRWSRRELRSAVRDLRPDLVHVVADPWMPTAEAGAAAARRLSVPYVLHVSAVGRGPRSITARWQAERVEREAAAIAGASRTALERLRRGSNSALTAIIPHGGVNIPARMGARPPANHLEVVYAGRLVRERGVDVLLTALTQVTEPWRLTVAGTGPAHAALEHQAQRLGLSSRIRWLGAIPRAALAELWQGTAAMVQPARSLPDWGEPTGALALEAMAFGVAPVVTRSGVLPDVVGEAGLVVESDDPAALARALQRLAAEPELAASLGMAARQRVLEHFSDGAIASRLVELWRQVVGAASGAFGHDG